MKITSMFILLITSYSVYGQSQPGKVLLYDTYHKNYDVSNAYPDLLSKQSGASIKTSNVPFNDSLLRTAHSLLLFFPQIGLDDREKEAVVRFLEKGGSLLLVFDEEKRTPFNGINEIIAPFDIQLTESDIPYVHNCGAIAQAGKVCKARREIPYSGGRAVIGGEMISTVYVDDPYVHSAYVETKAGGKIIVLADGMAALLMGSDKGERLTGTVPADTKYWGRDSKVFIKEILAFLLAD
ncbi:MAG: DUF4350 domain-containing protein [Bacteroidota bacterium]